MTMCRRLLTTSLTATCLAICLTGCGVGDDFALGSLGGFGKVELKVLLSGAGSLRAKVEYKNEPSKTKFEVEVFGGAPGAVLDVAINDTVVASVTLNQFGTGMLEFTTRPHELYHQAFPADFPTPVVGDIVSVGDMSGALYRHY